MSQIAEIQIDSELFETANVNLKTVPTNKTCTVKEYGVYLRSMFQSVSGDLIEGPLGKITFTNDKEIFGEVKVLKKAMTSDEIIVESQRINANHQYSISEALLLADAFYKVGPSKKLGYDSFYIFIFIEDKVYGESYGISISRRLSGLTDLDFRKLDPKRMYEADYAAIMLRS